MSVDSGTSTDAAVPAGVDCSLCDRRLDGDELFVQCYSETDRSPPSAAADDGFLAVCDDCAVEVDELVAAWTGHDDPVVAADHSIAAGYRRVTDDCSFCERPLDEDSLLGVEYYRRGDAAEAVGLYANYSLCAGCGPVFEEFLVGVGDGDRV